MGDNNVIVIGSDEEDEKALWKTNGTDDHFQKLFKKVKKIIFNQTKRSYISNGFPYGRFIEFAQELETALAAVPTKNTQRFIWRCVVRWLVPLKNCIREPTPLFDDWKYNYIVTDIMRQYINFKCEYYHERDEAIVKEQIEEIIRILEVAFSSKTEFVLITFLKIKIRYEYRNILIPLFRAYLISPFDYDANDFCKYICLVLCYRQWKRLLRTKESRETVNEYACGQSERLMGTFRAIDLTLNPVLPWEVPNATQRSEIFFKLHPHLSTARETKNGTRLLLASVWREWSFILRKFITLYEEYNGFSVRLEPEVPSVKLRDVDINSDDDDVIIIPNDDVIIITDDDDLPSADGSISNMNHLEIIEKLKRLAEGTPPKSLEEQKNTEKAMQNLRCRCGTGTQGTTMAVNQHLSKVCDISSLSKTLGFSSLRSLSIQVSVYLSIFKNEKGGSSCNCRYLGSSFNEDNICIVLDTTDEDCDDDDNYFVRDEVTDKIGEDFTINDLVDNELFERNAEIAEQPPAAVASVIAELKRRALEMGTKIQNRRPETPIVLSSDDDEPVVVVEPPAAIQAVVEPPAAIQAVVEPPAAVQEVNQNNVIIDEIVLSSSEDEAPAPEREARSPRHTPPPMDIEERPLRREKTRCITGEVSSTTSLDCSSTRNADNVSIANENVLENAREVGTLSVVRTSSPSGNDLSIADYSDISDDDLDICLAPRQRWSKFAKVVEEATSSTSELPIRDESGTPSDNVVFSAPCDRRRRSNSSSPCHTRANSTSDNSRLISPSSTFRTRRVRRYRARHFSRIPVRKFRTVTRASDDIDLPTCSRYLRRVPKHQSGGLENCKNTSDSNEKATCSRYVQKKSVVQNEEGEKENSDLKSAREKSPEVVLPTAARCGENVNESSSKDDEQTPPVSENVNSDPNKLMEDITKFIDSPVHSNVKTDCRSSKSTDEGLGQTYSKNVSSKETEDSLVLQIVPSSKGGVQLELSEEVPTDVVVERSIMATATKACSSKNLDENAFVLKDPVSEHSYFSKMNKSDQTTSDESEGIGGEEKSELSLTENMEHNKSQCSISARDQARMFESTPNGKLFSDDNDDLTYLREETRDSLERSPLSSVENDFLVEDELSSYELDNDDDIESPAYEPIIPKILDNSNDELVRQDNKTAEDEIRPSKLPDVTISNGHDMTEKTVDTNDLLNTVPIKENSDSSREKLQDENSKQILENTLLAGEHSAKQSTRETIAISKNDLATIRVSEQMHDLNADKSLHSSHCTLMTTKAPIDPIQNKAELDVTISENVIATESAVNGGDMNKHLIQRKKSVLDISINLPPSNSSIGDTESLSVTESASDISVVSKRPSSALHTTPSLSKDIDKDIETVTVKGTSNFEKPSLDSSGMPTVDLNQSKSDEGVGKTNEHANKSVSEAVSKSSEILKESGAEPEESPENSANTLSPSASVEISTEESEGKCATLSNLSNNESVSTVIPSLEKENGDKEEQKANETSNILKDQSAENPQRCSSPNNVVLSASSEKSADAVPTSVETEDQINGDEQKHLNLNEASIENEPNRHVSFDTVDVDEVKLQGKCDENNLTESITIIDDSVESLSSIASTPSSVQLANITERNPEPNQETESKKPITTEVMDENKGDDDEQRSAEKSEIDEVAADEKAHADVDVDDKKQPLLIRKSGDDVEILISDTSEQTITLQEHTSCSDVSEQQSFESAPQETSITDTSTDLENTAQETANKSNAIASDAQIKQTPEDETLPLEDNETSPRQTNNAGIEGGHQATFKTDVSNTKTGLGEKQASNVATESENNELSIEGEDNVETEVAPEKRAISEHFPSFQSNDTLIAIPEIESNHREIVQTSASALDNSSSAEVIVAPQGSEVKEISNEVDQIPPPSAVLPLEGDTLFDKDDASEMDCLSKDQSENFSENIADTESTDTSPDNNPVEDRSQTVSKELIDDRCDRSPNSLPCVAVPSNILPHTSTKANLDASSELQLDSGESGLSKIPRVDNELIQIQAKNNALTNDNDFLSRSPVASKGFIPQRDSPLTNGLAAEDLTVNVETTKCQETPSSNDRPTQDQGKRNVIRAAKQLLSIEDYAMVRSFQKVSPPFAEPCNAHITTVTRTPNLVDKIQTNPQNEPRVFGAGHKYNAPTDYSTTSPTVFFSNHSATRDTIRYKKRQRARKTTAKHANSFEKRSPMFEGDLNKAHHLKNQLRTIPGINVEQNLEANSNIISLTQQLLNSPFTAITRPSDALDAVKAKFIESIRPPSDLSHFYPRNANMCMPPGSVLCPENRFQLCTDRCCSDVLISRGSSYPNMAFRCHEPPYKPNNLPIPSVPFLSQRTEKDNSKNFTWPKAIAGISKNRQLQLCQPKPLEVTPDSKFSPYFVPERRCAPLLQGVLEHSTYRTHAGKIFATHDRMQTSIPDPVAKKQRVPTDSNPCFDYTKQTESLRKTTSDDVPINRNSNEGLSFQRKEMRFDSSADLKSEGNGPSFNTWSTEAEIQFLLKLQQTRSLNTGDDSNQSTQVEVASEDLGDQLSSFDSGTGYNSPAYGCETPYRESSTDCSSNAVTQPPEDLEDQEVSTITSQEVEPTTYTPYNDDCGTPVMDEKDAEDTEGSPCQGKIVSLSVLKQIPELPSLPSVPSQCDTPRQNVDKFPEDPSSNCCSVIGCLDASKNFIPIDMTNAPKEPGSACENRPVNSNSEFIEPSPKPKPTIDIDSEYQKTPLKMRIKRRISQCADINEAFNLGPSQSLKPIDILATQALERHHNESVVESGVDSVNQTPVRSFCNYPTDLSLKASDTTPEQEKDQNLLYQESWYKKLGKTKTIHQQHSTPMNMNSTQCTSDNSDALAMLQLSASHLNATSIASVEDTPLSAKNEGRRRKPIRVRKLADIYDRDNIANDPDIPASVYPIQLTQSAGHSLFTYPGVVQPPQQAVETNVPLQPISVLETAYNPEDIKAATILSDMLKTSYKIDESLKYRSPKTPKARKTTSPRSNKQASLQFRRMTRSTSHLLDKAPFIDTTNTLQLILPTTSPQLSCAQDSPPVPENSCANSIWQQDKTKEILRSLTAQASLEDKANLFHSNSSSDSDDVGKLVIDMDHTRGTDANKKSAAVEQTALEGSIPSTAEILDMTNVYLAKGTVKRNSKSIHNLTPGTDVLPRVQRHSVDAQYVLPNSPEYDVSALYPIVQLTELTPKAKTKRGSRKTNQPRSYVRPNGRRILNSPKPSAEKTITKVGRTAKSRKSPKAKADTLNGRQTEAKAAAVQDLPAESSSELSTSDNSSPVSPDKILPFSVEAILRGSKSSPQKPTPEIDSPSTPPEMASSSQEYWLKAFLLMRKSTEKVSGEPKEKQIQAPSLSEKEPVDGAAVSEGLPVPELKATTPQAEATSADKTHRRKKSLLPTRKISKSLTDTKVWKSEKDSSTAQEKAKNAQPKANRRKYNRTAKPIISSPDDSLESEQNNQDSPEIPKELPASKETEGSACEIEQDPAPIPTVVKPLLESQKIRKSKSVEDIVARLSKTVRKSKLRLSIEPELDGATLASGDVSPDEAPQQEPKESEDVLTCESPPSLKVSLQLSVIAGETKMCEKPESILVCNGDKPKRGRRKSEKKLSLEAIVEAKMETHLNEDQKTKTIEYDSSEITAVTVEAEKPKSRRKSTKEPESPDIGSEQPDQSSTAEPTTPVVSDKPKRRRSSNKKIENKAIESKEEDESDRKSVTTAMAANNDKTKLCQKSDEEMELSGSDQKETESLKEEQTQGRDEPNDSSEMTAIQAVPLEADDKPRNRRKSVKELESKDKPDQSSTAEPTSPVVADKPKRRRSSNKQEAGKSDNKSLATNENKTKLCHNSEGSSDSDQQETLSRKEDITPGRDEAVETDSFEETAILPVPVEADKPRTRRKSHKELECMVTDSKRPEISSITEPTAPVVADKPKRRRSSNKKIENKSIELREEDKSAEKSITSGHKKKTKLCQNSDEQIENSDSDQKETGSRKEETTPGLDEPEDDSAEVTAIQPALIAIEPTSPVVAEKPNRRRSASKKIEIKAIESREDVSEGKSKNKTKLCHKSDEEIEISAIEKETDSQKEEERAAEPVEDDSTEIIATQPIPVEADKPRNRRKSVKEPESKGIDSKQPEQSSTADNASPAVADKPKRLRSSNKKIENKAIESTEGDYELCHISDEQIENSNGDQKEAESQKEGRDDPVETAAIQAVPVEADKPRTRRKSHKELECKDIDHKQPENASITEHTSLVVAEKPKRRRSSNKKLENKPVESKEEHKSHGKSVAKNKTKLCLNSDEQIENSDGDQQETKARKEMAQMPEDRNDKKKTTSPESKNGQLSEITTGESVEAIPSPVVVEKKLPDKSIKNPYAVCKSTAMPNVEVEKCHLKRKCIMQIRRLSIDENNLKMTLSKSKEIVEKHKHAKKHSKRARRFSAEIFDIIRRNEETERRIKAHGGLCNDDKPFKVMKIKRTEDTVSTGVDDAVACETASIPEATTDPLTLETDALDSEIGNSADDEVTNLDESNEEAQVKDKGQANEAVPHEGTDKPKINGVKKVKLSTDTPADELPLNIDEEPSKERKSVKSRKRPVPRSQKAKEKSKRRRVEEVTSSDSEENEIVEDIVEECDTKSAESSPDTDSTLGVFKIVRSTVSQVHKPAPKSRKRLNSQHTTDRKRLVVLLRRTKPVKRTSDEAVQVNTVLPMPTKSGKSVKRRSLDCDNSRASSETSVRLRSMSTDMKRSPSSDQPSRKLKPFKLNISKLEACHKTLKEMNSTEPTTTYEAKLYDESERLAEQLNSFIKKILEDSEGSSSMLMTSRPQIFDRVPKDIFAGNGDVSDNIGAKYYSPVLAPKPYDIILKSKPAEDGNLKAKAVDEQEQIKPRSDADDQETENEDAENDNNSDGNTAPDLELDASEMPHIPDVGIICDEDSIPDLCAEAECLSEVLDEKINKEILDANIDTSTPFIRDYMISGNYRSNNYLDLSLLPEFEGISLLGVQNQFQNDNSDGDGLLVPKVENLADVEIDFGSELFLYSGCIQSQDSSGSSDEKREQECETPTPPVDAYLNSAHPKETVSETTANDSEIVNETVAEEVIHDTSIAQNQSPPVEVSSEVGFESYNELLAESNPFFLPSVQSNERSTSESQSDKEAAAPNTAEDTVENSTNETSDKEAESLSVDSGNSTPTEKEFAKDAVVEAKELPVKTKRVRIKVLPIESLKPETREEMCAPVKLKSRPIPFWKIKKIENKSTPSTNSVKEITKIDTPPVSASPVVAVQFSFDVGQPVEGVVPAQSCGDASNIDEASAPSDKPPGVVADVSTEGNARQLIKISQLPELNEVVEDTNSLDVCTLTKSIPIQSIQIAQLPELSVDTVHACSSSQGNPMKPSQLSQLPELNDTVDKLATTNVCNDAAQIPQLPELNGIPNNRPDFDHTYTSTQKMNKLPELNELPEHSKLPINTVQKLPESNKPRPDTRHSCHNPSKKIRSGTPMKLSIDDLFDRLKRESPVNPLTHKIKYALQKTESFDTDDNSSRDSCVGLLTVPESPHPATSNVPSPATFACESPLPIVPSMPIISTPSRHDSCPESNTSKTTYTTKISNPLRTAKSSPALDLLSKESDSTYLAPSTSKDLKRSHGKVDTETPEGPPKKIVIKATDSTPCVDKLEHVQASTKKALKVDKNLERLKKPSSLTTTPVSSPRRDQPKPNQRVHFSPDTIEIPKVDLFLSASKAKTESPRPAPKPIKSILVSSSKHSGSQSSDSSRRGRYRIFENNSLDRRLSPMSDGYTTSSHSQKVNSKPSPRQSSLAGDSSTAKTSQSSRRHNSMDITENNRNKKLPTTTPSTHSRSSSSAGTEVLIASLTAEIESIKNTLNRLPEPNTYAQHIYRKNTREMYEKKRQHLQELMKQRYTETERHSQAQLRSKSYSERQPVDNSSNYKASAQSSQREAKEKCKDNRRPYENKFAELGTKHSPIVDTYESRVGTCREAKRSSSWELKQITADEIIAELKMKKSRRN